MRALAMLCDCSRYSLDPLERVFTTRPLNPVLPWFDGQIVKGYGYGGNAIISRKNPEILVFSSIKKTHVFSTCLQFKKDFFVSRHIILLTVLRRREIPTVMRRFVYLPRTVSRVLTRMTQRISGERTETIPFLTRMELSFPVRSLELRSSRREM